MNISPILKQLKDINILSNIMTGIEVDDVASASNLSELSGKIGSGITLDVQYLDGTVSSYQIYGKKLES